MLTLKHARCAEHNKAQTAEPNKTKLKMAKIGWHSIDCIALLENISGDCTACKHGANEKWNGLSIIEFRRWHIGGKCVPIHVHWQHHVIHAWDLYHSIVSRCACVQGHPGRSSTDYCKIIDNISCSDFFLPEINKLINLCITNSMGIFTADPIERLLNQFQCCHPLLR